MKDIPDLSHCLLCPRRCGADRAAGGRAYCGETAELRIASASIHRGEEPVLTGAGGSGTVFVTGCNLGCVFCQNYQISRRGMGRAVQTAEFAAITLRLQELGAATINIVTGSHAVPAIAAGIDAARGEGGEKLRLPVLWNSSAYESLESLEILKDRVDVYLPDLKTLDPAVSARFFKTPVYGETASAAILRMMEYRPLRYKPGGEALESGVIVRHLALPGYLESTRGVLRWFAENCRGGALLSLMTQYSPVRPAGEEPGTGMPEGFLNRAEYGTIIRWLEEFGIDDGFCQELVRGDEWLPDFSRGNPFSSDLSLPVWHWRFGFIN
ncbi:MAG: radical SAM protein [Treponema sp.]|jgi:putative pyruvate formate lyase activating enzyme|nr:radical SAM protein [Treponema sp.]